MERIFSVRQCSAAYSKMMERVRRIEERKSVVMLRTLRERGNGWRDSTKGRMAIGVGAWSGQGEKAKRGLKGGSERRREGEGAALEWEGGERSSGLRTKESLECSRSAGCVLILPLKQSMLRQPEPWTQM